MKDFLSQAIFEIDDYSIKVSTIMWFVAFLGIIILLLQIVRKTIYRSSRIDIAKQYSIYRLIKYFTLILSSIIGLQILGLNLSVLIAGSAALLVGIGLGLQYLFSDFVSGIILLADSTIKVNDIIEVNGLVCKVEEINLRTTTVLTREDKYIILPNSDLTRNQIINWTHSDIASRFDVLVGVDYSSDVTLVMKILKEVVDSHEGILQKPAPFIRFIDFGESSLNFSVIFWSEHVFRVENIKSEIRVKIFEAFKTNGIQIPFPQSDVHIKK